MMSPFGRPRSTLHPKSLYPEPCTLSVSRVLRLQLTYCQNESPIVKTCYHTEEKEAKSAGQLGHPTAGARPRQGTTLKGARHALHIHTRCC